MLLEIYDSAGKVVRRISDLSIGNSFIGTEKLLFEWDGTNQGGTDLENGLYFYRLVINDLNNNKSFRNCGSDIDVVLSGKIIKMQ